MLGYDDSLDAFGVHGLGGTWGALASGLFAATLGAGDRDNAQQIMVQLKGIGFTAVFAPVATFVILLRCCARSSARCASTTRTSSTGSTLGAQRERLRLRRGERLVRHASRSGRIPCGNRHDA